MNPNRMIVLHTLDLPGADGSTEVAYRAGDVRHAVRTTPEVAESLGTPIHTLVVIDDGDGRESISLAVRETPSEIAALVNGGGE